MAGLSDVLKAIAQLGNETANKLSTQPKSNMSSFMSNMKKAAQQTAAGGQQWQGPQNTRGASQNFNNFSNVQDNPMPGGFTVYGNDSFDFDSEGEDGESSSENKRKRAPWHERQDEMLGENGIGTNLFGMAGDVLSGNPGAAGDRLLGMLSDPGSVVKGTANELLSAGEAPLDIIAPEWAFQGPQKDSETSRQNKDVLNAPRTIVENGQYLADPNQIAMPSGDQLSDLTPEQLEEWYGNTGEGMILSAVSAANALSGGGVGTGIRNLTKGVKSPVLERSAMGDASRTAGNVGRNAARDEMESLKPEYSGAARKSLNDVLEEAGLDPHAEIYMRNPAALSEIVPQSRMMGMFDKTASKAAKEAAKATENSASSAKFNPAENARQMDEFVNGPEGKALRKEFDELAKDGAPKASAKTAQAPAADSASAAEAAAGATQAEAAGKSAKNTVENVLKGLNSAVKAEAKNKTKVAKTEVAAREAAKNPYTQSAIDYAIKNIEKKAGRGKGQGEFREIWNLEMPLDETEAGVNALRDFGNPRTKLQQEIDDLKQAGKNKKAKKKEKELAKLGDEEYNSQPFMRLAEAMEGAAKEGGHEISEDDWARTLRAINRANWLPKATLGAGFGAGMAGLGAALLSPTESSLLSGEAPGPGSEGGGPGDESLLDEIQRGHNRTQLEAYNQWLNSESDEARRFAELYPELVGDLGYSNLRASNNPEAWSYVLGLTDGVGGIQDFRNRYSAAGVDLSSDDALDQLMDYLYGDNAIDINEYMYNQDYRRALGMSADSIGNMGQWLAENYDWGPGQQWMDSKGMDAADMAYLALAEDYYRNGSGNWDLDLLNQMAHDAGEAGTFKLADEDSEEYRNATRRDRPKDYDLRTIALGLDPYEGTGIIDQYMSDSFINWYNSQHPNGKKLYLSFD